MTIEELLEELDGSGIIVTDWDLVVETLDGLRYDIKDEFEVPHPINP